MKDTIKLETTHYDKMKHIFLLDQLPKFESISDFFVNITSIFFLTFVELSLQLSVVMFLIFADFIFGIFASYKKNVKITSRKMSVTATKLMLYFLIVFSVHIVDKFIIKSNIATTSILIYLCIIELKSISENFELIFNTPMVKFLIGLLSRSVKDKNVLEEFKEDKTEDKPKRKRPHT